jgi:hypothetical protein
MNLIQSNIPDLKELDGIGYEKHYVYATMQQTYNSLLAFNNTGCSAIIASVIKSQNEAIKFLLANGFIKVGRAKKNPNSRNSILLFIKFISKKSNRRNNNALGV